MPAYLNADGLYIRTGQDAGTAVNTGEFNVGGNDHWVEAEIALTSLGLTSTLMSNTVSLPIGARIREVHVIAETAATSGGLAVLNVGLYRLDRTTAIDADGLVAALALTSIDAAGEETVLRVGSTGAGALIGTTLVNPGLIVADYDTAAYTGGRVLVRVRWYRP